jgi:hypothetical protein
MKAAILRLFVPTNGGAVVERDWVDDQGNPSSYRVLTWWGWPPFGAGGLRGGGLRDGGEDQA